MPRRVLVLMSQFPHDPTSGAARSVLGIARELAAAGHEVRCLGTTATEGGLTGIGPGFLGALGLRVDVDRRAAVGTGRVVLRCTDAGVRVTLMDTGTLAIAAWDFIHGMQFNRLLVKELETHPPDVVLTFGGAPAEQSRRQIVRASGAAVVFALMNLAYLHPLAFDGVDAVITPSAFLSNLYRERIGLTSTPLPDPIDPADVIAATNSRSYWTFVNPTPAKGVFFFARIAQQLARRPDVLLQVIEARGRSQHLYQAALNGGFDLRGQKNLRVVPTRARPRDVFADAKGLLMPSLWPEPAGRLSIEALFNGVPPLVADRGGLRESVGSGGLCLSIPPAISETDNEPASANAVAPWVDAILSLHDDPARYHAACEAARAEAAKRDPAVIRASRAAFFEQVQPSRTPVVQAELVTQVRNTSQSA